MISVTTALYGRRVDGSVLCDHAASYHNLNCDATGAADLAVVQGRFILFEHRRLVEN